MCRPTCYLASVFIFNENAVISIGDWRLSSRNRFYNQKLQKALGVYVFIRNSCRYDVTPSTDSRFSLGKCCRRYSIVILIIFRLQCKCNVNAKEYALQQKFSEVSVGLCEETGFQSIPKLFTTDGWWAKMWWKRVPFGWGCNMETPSTKLCSCRRDKHVMAFSWTKMYPARDASDWDADVVKVGRTVLTDTVTDTVKRRDCVALPNTFCRHFLSAGNGPCTTFLTRPDYCCGELSSYLKRLSKIWEATTNKTLPRAALRRLMTYAFR